MVDVTLARRHGCIFSHIWLYTEEPVDGDNLLLLALACCLLP